MVEIYENLYHYKMNSETEERLQMLKLCRIIDKEGSNNQQINMSGALLGGKSKSKMNAEVEKVIEIYK